MLKVRNLTESLEKKYNLDEGAPTLDELPFDEIMNKESTEGNMDWYEEDHPTWKRYQYKKEVDEAYEYEMEDELDYIMDDDSLSDDEKEQAISDLYSKYNLHESNSCDGWIAFYNDKKLEIPKSDVDGGIYAAKQKAIKELKVPKSNIGLLSIKPAYNESLNEDWDDDYYNGDKYSLVGQDGNAFALMGYTARCMKECGLHDEIPNMREEAMSSDYNNLICVCDSYVQKCNDIARDVYESLKESFFEPTEWFDDFVNNYETYTPEEWNNWDQERRDAEVMKSMKLFLIDNPLSEDDAKEFMDDLEDNNFHTAARALAKLCNL